MKNGISTIEKQLEENGRWLFQTVGDSMEPLLRSRESTVQIMAGNTDLQPYDVVLFKRPSGKYVLHRIRRIRGDLLYICGDNRVGLEKVPRKWVLGKMTGYFPSQGPVFIRCSDPDYQKYIKSLPGKYRKLWIQRLPDRIRRKIRSLFQNTAIDRTEKQ